MKHTARNYLVDLTHLVRKLSFLIAMVSVFIVTGCELTPQENATIEGENLAAVFQEESASEEIDIAEPVTSTGSGPPMPPEGFVAYSLGPDDEVECDGPTDDITCYVNLNIVDVDGDGYVREDLEDYLLYELNILPENLDNYIKCYECKLGVKCVCPDYMLKDTEDAWCDRYYLDDKPFPDFYKDNNHYRRLFREYDLADQAIPPSKNFYWRIHPNQREVPYNGVDDDCDGWVDENEPLFFHNMSNVTSSSVTVRVRVNDFVVKKLASKMEIRAYRLNNLTPDDIEDIIDEGDVKSGLYDTSNDFPYNGEDIAEDTLGGLLPATVYVFQVSFREQTQSTPWSIYETMCSVDPENGSRKYLSYLGECPTPPDNEDRNRIHTDIYVAMTDIGTSPPQMEAFRPHIVNRAFYEWNLSEMGLVGKQKKMHDLSDGGSVHHEPFTILAEYPDHLTFFKNKPGGTRYDADYGETWCSEFCEWTYDKYMSFSYPWSYDVTVSSMITWFLLNGDYYSGSAARDRILDMCEPTVWDPEKQALPGDYLAMKQYKHSGILVGCTGIGGGYPLDDGWVWRVHGGCGDALCFYTTEKELMNLDKDGEYYFAGLGQF